MKPSACTKHLFIVSDASGASANQTVSRYIKLLEQTHVRDNLPSVPDPKNKPSGMLVVKTGQHTILKYESEAYYQK